MNYKHVVISQLDVLILLKIIALGDKKWFQMDIAETLGISQSEVSKSLKRLIVRALFSQSSNKMILSLFISYPSLLTSDF